MFNFARKKNINPQDIANQNDIMCPRKSSDVYILGISIKKSSIEIFNTLAELESSRPIKRFLEMFIVQEEKEIDIFNEWFKFELNCAASLFYESNGTVLPPVMTDLDLDDINRLVKRNLDNFEEQINSLKSGNLTIDDSTDLIEFYLKLRDDYLDLFQRLSRLYPPGEIRNSFEEIIQIIDSGTQEIRKSISTL